MSAYAGQLLKISGQNIPHLVKYNVGRNKLWKDADRSMSGEVKATLIGIFPKIEIEIGYTSESEMSTITSLLDQAYFTLTYFDVRTQSTHSAKYYASDYTIELDSKIDGRYKPFSVSLVPCQRRSY